MITADVYGEGEADALLGRALAGRRPRLLLRWSARSATTSSRASATARAASRASPTRACAARTSTPPTCAGRPRRASSGSAPTRFDLLLLHNPDRTGFTSRGGLGRDGGAARRRPDRARSASRPGPANGFTLDLLDCFERFGDRIDWAMVILNPLEPWPGELCLDAAAEHGIRVITRVVDYGGLFWDDVAPGHEFAESRPPPLPARGLGRGRTRAARADAPDRRRRRADPDAARLPVEPRPRRGRVRRADADPGGRRRTPARSRTSAPSSRRCPSSGSSSLEVEQIRAIGDNTGSMALKGASPEHEGDGAARPLAAERRAGRRRSPLGRRPRARPAPRDAGAGRRERLAERFAAWILTGRSAASSPSSPTSASTGGAGCAARASGDGER